MSNKLDQHNYEPIPINQEPATAETMNMFIHELTYGLKAILASEKSGFLSVEDQNKIATEFGGFFFIEDRSRPIGQVIRSTFVHTGYQIKQECQQQLQETVPENESQMHQGARAMLDLVDYFYDNIRDENYKATSSTIINIITPVLIQKIKEFFRRFPDPLFEFEVETQEVSLTAEVNAGIEDGVSEIHNAVEEAISPEMTLERFNQILEGLGFTRKYNKLPVFREEYAPLQGKKVLIVDDSMSVITEFIPELLIATGGNARFVHHQEQSTNDLVEDEFERVLNTIIAENPDIVLMDLMLANNIRGTEVVRQLRAYGFETAKIIGFSSLSGKDIIEQFQNAGALYATSKDPWGSTADSVTRVAHVVKNTDKIKS